MQRVQDHKMMQQFILKESKPMVVKEAFRDTSGSDHICELESS